MRIRIFVGLAALLLAPFLAWGQVVIPGTGGPTPAVVAGNRTSVIPALCTGTDKVSGIATGGIVVCNTDILGTGTSPLTTKGDLWGFNTVDDRLPVGTNDFCLIADSTAAFGIKWDTCPGGVTSVFTRSGAVVAVEGDYSLTLLSDVSGTSGSGSTAVLGTFAGIGASDFAQWTGSDWVDFDLFAAANSWAGLNTFVPSGLGGLADFDIQIGDTDGTPTYGMARLGNSFGGRTSFISGSLDLDGAVLWVNQGGPVTSDIEFAWMESSSVIRFAIAGSGAGLGTYSPRSLIIAGPAPANSNMVNCDTWTTDNANIDCDTAGTGADLFVQDDAEIEGTVFAGVLTEGGNAVPNSTDTLDFFAPTTSAEFLGMISNETGTTGLVVASINPTLTDVTINDLITFTESAGDATCAAGDYWVKGNSTSNKMRGCENGTAFDLNTAGGGNSFGTIGNAVADSASDTLTVTDSGTIDFTTTDAPEDLTAIVIADSITATELDETVAYALSSTTNTFVGASYTDGSGAAAGAGVLRCANAVACVAAEAAPAGTDGTITYDATEQWAFNSPIVVSSGGTDQVQLGSGTNLSTWQHTFIEFEGSTDDGFETTFNITDPTADRAVTVPNADSTTVQPDTGAANNFLTAISAAGVISKAQPDFSDLAGAAAAGQYGAASIDGDDINSNLAGSGLVLTAAAPDTLDIDLIDIDDQTGSTSNESGMEFGGTGGADLGLLRGCSNGQVEKFNTTGGLWECADDDDSGGATAWSSIGDAAADGSIDFVATQQDIVGQLDAAAEVMLTLTNQDADAANSTTILSLQHNDGADAEVVYLSLIGDADGSPTSDYLFTQVDFTSLLPIVPPAEAYDASGWDADTGAPQKDAVRDKIESLDFSDLAGTVAAGQYAAGSIDGDDLNSNLGGTGLTLTAASPDTLDCDAASTTAVGCPEMAINTEVDTGTSTILAVTPDALAGSVFGQVTVQMTLFDFTTAVTTGDGKYFFHIAEGDKLIGMDLISLTAAVVTVSSSGLPTVDVARCAPVATGNPCSGTVVDVLSTDLTIDVNEDSSFTAAAAFAIDTANDDVVEDGMWRIDVDIAGTGTQGLIVTLIFQLP